MRQTHIIDWLLMACVVACILRLHGERKGVNIYGRCGNPSEYPYEEQMMIEGADTPLGHGIRDGRHFSRSFRPAEERGPRRLRQHIFVRQTSWIFL